MTYISWIAASLTLLSVYLIGQKKSIGHLISVFGCILWMIEMWSINIIQVILNLIFIILYLYNFYTWNKLQPNEVNK